MSKHFLTVDEYQLICEELRGVLRPLMDGTIEDDLLEGLADYIDNKIEQYY